MTERGQAQEAIDSRSANGRELGGAALGPVVSYLPTERRTNESLAAEFPDWTAEKLQEKTGIAERRLAGPDEFASDLATRAAERLFELQPDARDGIDYVRFVTITPDYLAPSTATLVQDQLGLPQTTGAIDLLCACAGFPYALTFAAGLVESGRARRVLVLTADRMQGYVAEGGVGVKALMGDGATACLVDRIEPGGSVDTPDGAASTWGRIGQSGAGTDGSGARKLYIPTSGVRGFDGDEVRETTRPTMEMDGAAVFHFTLRVVPSYIRDQLERAGVGLDDVDLFVFHQANKFMLDHLRRRLKIPEERFVYYIEETGNTVASTVPLALEQARLDGRIQPGSRVFLMAFGTGWAWSSVLLEYAG